MIKILVVSILAVLIYAGCPPREVKGDPDKVLKKDGWTLKVWVTSRGTRSEGRISTLYKDGEELCPRDREMRIDTPLGRLEYEDSPYLWGWHGWKPLESNR